MSTNADYGKYYKTALKKFTEIAEQPSSQIIRSKSITHKTNKKDIKDVKVTKEETSSLSPPIYTLSSSLTSTLSSSPPQISFPQQPPSQQSSPPTSSTPTSLNQTPSLSQKKQIESSYPSIILSSIHSSSNSNNVDFYKIDWPEEDDGWVYIKNSVDDSDCDGEF